MNFDDVSDSISQELNFVAPDNGSIANFMAYYMETVKELMKAIEKEDKFTAKRFLEVIQHTADDIFE